MPYVHRAPYTVHIAIYVEFIQQQYGRRQKKYAAMCAASNLVKNHADHVRMDRKKQTVFLFTVHFAFAVLFQVFRGRKCMETFRHLYTVGKVSTRIFFGRIGCPEKKFQKLKKFYRRNIIGRNNQYLHTCILLEKGEGNLAFSIHPISIQPVDDIHWKA